MSLTEEQILALAPDDSSRKAGKDLSNPSKWVSRGVNEKALWGECQGSGSKPYQAQADLVNLAFKCSCPSRKFPCKHGLGLLLLYSREPNAFIQGPEPAWVSDWLSKRNEKQEKQAEKKNKPVDEAAQAKRQQSRHIKVMEGIDELQTWLKDIVRNGIIHMPEKGPAFFENMARRMVDAQAPGLAGMIRWMSEINFYTEGWPSRLMDQLLKTFMVAEGYKQAAALPEPLQQDLKTTIGFTQNQDELKSQEGISDTWLVLGKQVTEADSITTEKNWLYGTTTNRYAVVLQFIIRGQGMEHSLTPGMFLNAELVFYPSASPVRALIKKQSAAVFNGSYIAFENWQQVLESGTDTSSRLPFAGDRPFIVSDLTPVQYNNQWWLQDKTKALMQLRNGDRLIWKLLSLSGGEPLNMTVIGREDAYEPMGVWKDRQYKIL